MPSRRPISAFVRVLVQSLLSLLIFVPVLVVEEADAGQLTASWVDNSGGQAAFAIERRRATDPTYVPLADVPPGVTVYVDPAISDGITYCYRVLAYDSTMESPYSEEACGTSTSASASAYAVTVTKAGTGTGTVASAPAGIDCGTDCSQAYVTGTLVTLTATAAPASKFVGWGGGCSGTSTCTVIGNTATTVSATFNVHVTGRTRNGGEPKK